MVRSYLKFTPAARGGVYVGPQCNRCVFVSQGKILLPQSQNQSQNQHKYLLGVGALRRLNFIDTRTGDVVYSKQVCPEDGTVTDEGYITTLTTHNYGEFVVAGLSTGRVSVFQYDPEERGLIEVASTAAHKYNTKVEVISFSHDGTWMATAGQDTHIVLWDMSALEATTRLISHHGPIVGIHFIENTNALVSVGNDGLIKVWDLESRACVHTVVATDVAALLTCSVWVPSLQQLFVASRDELVRVYSVVGSSSTEDGEGAGDRIPNPVPLAPITRKYKKGIVAMHVQYTSSGSMRILLQSGDRCVEVLEPVTSRKSKRSRQDSATGLISTGLKLSGSIYAQHSRIASIVAAPAATSFASSRGSEDIVLCLTDNAIEIVRGSESSADEGGKEPKEPPRYLNMFGHQGDVRSCALVQQNNAVYTLSPSDGLRTWRFDFDSSRDGPRVVCTGLLEAPGLTCFVALPNGTHAIGGADNGTLSHLYLPDYSIREVIPAHEGGITCMCLANHGRGVFTVYTGGKDKTIRNWKFDKQLRLREDKDRAIELTDVPVALTVDAQNKFIAAALQDTNIKVHFADTLKPFLTLYGHKYAVTSISISDDCEMLASASADKNVKLWGLDFGDLHRSIIAHDDYVLSVTFMPNTHYIVTGGKDGTAKMWDADTWTLIQHLPQGSSGAVNSVAVATDGSFVFTCGADRNMRVFERTEDLVFPHEETQRIMELAADREAAERGAFEAIKNSNEEGAGGAAATHRTASAAVAADRLMEVMDALAQGRGKPSAVWVTLRDEVRGNDMYHALGGLPLHYAVKILEIMVGLFEEGNVIDNADVAVSVVNRILRVHYQSLSRYLTTTILSKVRKYTLKEKERIGHNLAGLNVLQNYFATKGLGNVFVDVT